MIKFQNFWGMRIEEKKKKFNAMRKMMQKMRLLDNEKSYHN